jgi:hypothetical protein
VVAPHRADRVGEICHEAGDNAVPQDERWLLNKASPNWLLPAAGM